MNIQQANTRRMKLKFTTLFLLIITFHTNLFADDSIWKQLKETELKYDQLSNEQKAQYGMILYENLVKYDGPSDLSVEDCDPSFAYIDFSIEYYKKKSDKTDFGNCCFYKATILSQLRLYPEATQALLPAIDYINNFSDRKLPGKLYFTLGRIASFQDEFQDALNYLDEAESYLEKENDRHSISKVYTLKSWIYTALEDFEKAITLSRKSMQYTNDSIVVGDALNDIGNNYYFLDQIDSALYYSKLSINYPYVEPNLSLRYYHLADAFNLKHELDSARKYALIAINLPIDIHIEDECYRILIDVATQLGDDKNLRHYINHKQETTDSIMKLKGQIRVSSVKEMYNAHKENNRLSKINSYAYTIVFSSILLLVVCIFIINRYHKKRHLRRAAKYKVDMEEKEEMLSNLSEVLEKKQSTLIEQLTEELNIARKKYRETGKALTYEEREKKIYNEVLFLEQEDAFINKMNRILNNFPQKIKEAYPNITHKEIKWCCLFMINIPTKEMAMLLDYTQSSLYKFKQRLSHKLGLKSTKQLEELLERIMNSNH